MPNAVLLTLVVVPLREAISVPTRYQPHVGLEEIDALRRTPAAATESGERLQPPGWG